MTKDYIAEKFISSGIDIDEKRASMFALYCDMLVSWSGKMNLTSVTDEKEIVSRHFIDSLLPLRSDFVTRDAVCADIGTGAGFPGVPVAIMRPDTDMYLIDSLKKRLVFLDAVIRELGLENCRTLHTRAEDAAKGELREKFDIVFSRAVARTATLAELCLPLVKEGGLMLALKSTTAREELDEAGAAIETLGGREEQIFGTDDRNMIVIRKTGKTPLSFPRKAGKAACDPILRKHEK